MFWMSRYLERAGNTSRLLEINLRHMLEAEDDLTEEAQWRPLLAITASQGLYQEIYGNDDVSGHKIVQFLTRERRNPNAILSSLRLARENARVVRDRISSEMWETINQLWLTCDHALINPIASERAPALFNDVRDGVARFHGFSVSTMTRGEAFGFYLLGTFTERADMTARILDVKYHVLLPDVAMVGSALDYYQWAALLRSLSGFEEYRHRYHTGLRPTDVVEFAIFESEFPRSLRFAVERMRNALEGLGGPQPGSGSGEALEALQKMLDDTSAEKVVAGGLHEFIERFLQGIADLNASVSREYFKAYLGGEVAVSN
jgi:uncharacterized alpha-E superfamily protein